MSIDGPSLRKHVGDLSQLVSVTPCVLTEGRASGTRALLVNAGSGLDAMVLQDRGLDLGFARYRGTPLAWLSPVGVVHPAGFQEHDWLRSFPGGLLTTCGLSNVGPPATVLGITEPMHGRYSNLPASNVAWAVEEGPSGLDVVISGQVRETTVYGNDVVARRTLRFPADRPEVQVEDHVVNQGWADHELMLLYHVNLGYPIVDAHAELVLDECPVVAMNQAAREALGRERMFDEPTHGAGPEVFSHQVRDKGRTSAGVWNGSVPGAGGLGVAVDFDTRSMPYLLQWRMPGEGVYVIGIEPSNTLGQGYEQEHAGGRTDVMAPGATRDHSIVIRVVQTRDAILAS